MEGPYKAFFPGKIPKSHWNFCLGNDEKFLGKLGKLTAWKRKLGTGKIYEFPNNLSRNGQEK